MIDQQRLRFLARKIHALANGHCTSFWPSLTPARPCSPVSSRDVALPPDFIRELGGDRLSPPRLVGGRRR